MNTYPKRNRGEIQIDVEKIVESVDLNKANELKRKYLPTESFDFYKYLDAEICLYDACIRAEETGLDKLTGKRVLDLGCGAGYIPYVYKHFGHVVVGVDARNDPFYIDMAKLLGIDYHVLNIKRKTPACCGLGRFDYVTAHAVTFDEHWCSDDYIYFLNDVSKNILNPSGKLFMSLNYNWRYKHIQDMFINYGCDLSINRVRFSNGNKAPATS